MLIFFKSFKKKLILFLKKKDLKKSLLIIKMDKKEPNFDDIKMLNEFEAFEIVKKEEKNEPLTDMEKLEIEKKRFVARFSIYGILFAEADDVRALWPNRHKDNYYIEFDEPNESYLIRYK
jgi:hypothetical protein